MLNQTYKKLKKQSRTLLAVMTIICLLFSIPSAVTAAETDAGTEAVTATDTNTETDTEPVVIDTADDGFSLTDILLVPMGFIIRICYSLLHNYALALFMFALIMQAILFPLGIKQQKNSVKQASLRPKERAIRNKYAGRDDAVTKKKCNDEIMALYQQENFNPAGGCLPLLIQLPIIFALFAVVRAPLTYITRLSSGVITSLQTQIEAITGKVMTVGYHEIDIISYLRENGTAGIVGLDEFINESVIDSMPNFKIFGSFDLSIIPSSDMWSIYLLVPILTFVVMVVTMKLQKRFMYRPETGTATDKQTAGSMKIMEWVTPVMCVYFAFIVPAAIGVYWVFRNILAFVQQVILAKMYPIPKFTEEELKAAEREYLGKSKSKPQGAKAARDPSSPRPRSLHSIDFDDDESTADTKPAVKTAEPEKTAGALAPAPLKSEKDKPKKKPADKNHDKKNEDENADTDSDFDYSDRDRDVKNDNDRDSTGN